MTRTSPRTTLSLCALTLLATAALLFAGPLDPPAGPVTSTHKTLTEVEPRIAINATNTPGDADSLYRIIQPGSYYLTGNIAGVAGKHGIEIATSGVTLDLNGFDLRGVSDSLDGVSCTVNFQSSIEVRNGSIRNWGGDGLDLLSLTVRGSTVSGIRATANFGMGIGIGNSSTATDCEAQQNVGDGILTGHGCTITRCTASNNGGDGMGTSTSCIVTECAFYQNTSDGLHLGNGCQVKNCMASENGVHGINMGNDCSLTGCSSSGNAAIGISADTGCMIVDCRVNSNRLDGIRGNAECVIRGNVCRINGNGGDGAGIHTTGRRNQIEGNTCMGADRGVDVDGVGNITIKNTCAGNTTNWTVPPVNVGHYQIAAPLGGANGDQGGFPPQGFDPDPIDPNINFSFDS